MTSAGIRKLSGIILSVLILASLPLYSRDIDLDKIYINESCSSYASLREKKIDIYKNAGSGLIDKNVAFADWLNGREIVYISEIDDVNIVLKYDIYRRSVSEIARFNGTVTYFKVSRNGKFIALKKFSINKIGLTEAEIIVLATSPEKKIQIKSSNLFADFTVSYSGQSLLMERDSGIAEFFPDTDIYKIKINKNEYDNFLSGFPNRLAFQSPDGNKFAILSGQAGQYRAVVIGEGRKQLIENISSSMEFFWVDNSTIIYRKGGPGSFSSVIYNIKSREEQILESDSFNTGLNYTEKSKCFTFLKSQLISLYYLDGKKIRQTGLEGEDSSISPDSLRFISIYNRNLFISNFVILEKRSSEIRKAAAEIHVLYMELIKMKSCWKNEFSNLYLKRKAAAYKQFLGT